MGILTDFRNSFNETPRFKGVATLLFEMEINVDYMYQK